MGTWDGDGWGKDRLYEGDGDDVVVNRDGEGTGMEIGLRMGKLYKRDGVGNVCNG